MSTIKITGHTSPDALAHYRHTVADIPDVVLYEAAGLPPPEVCGVCHESRVNLTDEIGPSGPIKVCAACRVER